jgi:hypothetical protein
MTVIPSHAPDISEAALQRLILGRLAVLERKTCGACFFWRQNVVAAKAGKRFIRAGVPGQPDIGGIVDGRAWGIEVKRRRGRVSAKQEEYRVYFERAGGRFVVARTLAEALVPVCQALGLAFVVEPQRHRPAARRRRTTTGAAA